MSKSHELMRIIDERIEAAFAAREEERERRSKAQAVKNEQIRRLHQIFGEGAAALDEMYAKQNAEREKREAERKERDLEALIDRRVTEAFEKRAVAIGEDLAARAAKKSSGR